MSRYPLLATLTAASCLSSLAHAQSSVTVYGVADVGMTYISNEGGSSTTALKDGVLFGNRLGFRGQEDLGGGYAAHFTLEQGLNLGTGQFGQGGRAFGRQSFVGLKTPYGNFSAGRQYDAIKDYLNPLNIGGWATTYAGHHGDFDRISGGRVDGSVRYASPDLGGLTFTALYAAKTSNSLQTVSAGAGYKTDKLSLGAAYFRQKGGTVYPDLQMGFSDFLGVAMSGTGTPVTLDTQETIGLGGSYDFGAFNIVANATTTKMELGTNSERQKVFEVGSKIKASDKVTAFVAWQHSRMAGAKWNQPTMGAWYSLSRRSWFYTAVSYMKASSGIQANQGAGFYFGNSSNSEQTSVRLGMVHMF
ncbi:hypothetical protein AAV94_06345 [Lampropedia cohaerens]|uniref:Porin domain-containing protein n=1 Tax=Lampropedia cohaerens TaxID=1610491 RepID=A0A0U1Q014_9BURK|nr:porin [Lampropedia cohaerens]KKW68103.1 hypothetical protein AAV94_06345 [Lampropedia cohaerens]